MRPASSFPNNRIGIVLSGACEADSRGEELRNIGSFPHAIYGIALIAAEVFSCTHLHADVSAKGFCLEIMKDVELHPSI